MGKAKRKILSGSHRRFLQRFKRRRQWARVMLRAMQCRGPTTKNNEKVTRNCVLVCYCDSLSIAYNTLVETHETKVCRFGATLFDYLFFSSVSRSCEIYRNENTPILQIT